MRVRKLQEVVQMKGLIYKLIDRTETKALYSRHKPDDDAIHSYEVFQIALIKSQPFNIGSNSEIYDMIEKFPDSRHYGKKAWLFTDPVRARKKYAAL